MEHIDKYIKSLIDACKVTIEQMTHLKVAKVSKARISDGKSSFPFSHVITYSDCEKKINGNFILAFENTHDALELASAISVKLGLDEFKEICEDSTDLLNEFLNIVVGRTISEWDGLGLNIKFGTPVFKKNHKYEPFDQPDGYIVMFDAISVKRNSHKNITLRVDFIEKKENKIMNKRILLVDDSKVMRGLIAKTLKKEGAVIKEAGDGQEAINIYKTFLPDLTLMDINMPEMNGFDSIINIRKFSPDSKFIILSSSSKKEEIIKVKTLKLSGYLIKPADQNELLKRVSDVL